MAPVASTRQHAGHDREPEEAPEEVPAAAEEPVHEGARLVFAAEYFEDAAERERARDERHEATATAAPVEQSEAVDALAC